MRSVSRLNNVYYLHIGIMKVIYIPPNDSIIYNSAVALNLVYYRVSTKLNEKQLKSSFRHIFDPRASKARS